MRNEILDLYPYLYYEGCIKWLKGFNYSSSYFHIRWHLAYEPEIESGNCIKQFGGAESFRFDFQFWKTQHIIMKFLQVILDSIDSCLLECKWIRM